jgi:protoheme ferro-lyase
MDEGMRQLLRDTVVNVTRTLRNQELRALTAERVLRMLAARYPAVDVQALLTIESQAEELQRHIRGKYDVPLETFLQHADQNFGQAMQAMLQAVLPPGGRAN